MISNVAILNKPTDQTIKKSHNSNNKGKLNDKFLVPKLDFSACIPDRKIAPDFCRGPKIEKETYLENANYDIELFEKIKSDITEEMTSQNLRTQELEEKMNFQSKETELKINKMEHTVAFIVS
ncbi:unnamed protein product [Brachionus calyciflorus]|uniref:Uncharacterized protein n=1 Tax=Brachionus calyciflorus TaxID=104777 RepID=A0A814ARM2_9BILA|nr:unnamed protein product [Brachionus calyciflorus]